MMKTKFNTAVKACLENGKRLLDDADYLVYSEQPSTAYALAIIAQEELAKAFLLHLVAEGVIPWNQLTLRATRDHTCKQLLCVVMDFLNPDIDEFLARMNAAVLHGKPFAFPSHVADAINIFRHEKISRWESKNLIWEENPEYDKTALAIADGRLDREKQDALYVRLGRTGEIASTPVRYTREMVDKELERGKRLAQLVEQTLERELSSIIDYEEVTTAFKALFSSIESKTEDNTESNSGEHIK